MQCQKGGCFGSGGGAVHSSRPRLPYSCPAQELPEVGDQSLHAPVHPTLGPAFGKSQGR